MERRREYMGFFTKAKRSPTKKGGVEEQEELKRMIREMMEETRRLWGRLEESLGELRRDKEGDGRIEEEGGKMEGGKTRVE